MLILHNHWLTRSIVLTLCLVAQLPALAATPPAPVAVTVSPTSVRVTVTPGSEIVLLSVAKRTKNGANYLETNGLLLRDTDNDGVVSLDGPVPLRSVWIAVDLAGGSTANGALPDFPLHVSAIAPAMFRKDAENEIAALEQEIPRLVLFLVRPQKGAWMLMGREGGDHDRDGEANGQLNLRFEDARPVAGGKENAPKHLKAGDVVVAVDPGRLDVFLGEVTK